MPSQVVRLSCFHSIPSCLCTPLAGYWVTAAEAGVGWGKFLSMPARIRFVARRPTLRPMEALIDGERPDLYTSPPSCEPIDGSSEADLRVARGCSEYRRLT
jgi:hypothetical protein